MEIFLIDNADDAVNRLLIHRQARKACFRKEVGDFLHGARLIHGFHVYARRHDIDGFKVVELDDVVDKLAFVFVDTAVVLGFLHDGEQFAFRNGTVVRDLYEFFHQLFDAHKTYVNGLEDVNEHVDDRRGKHSERFRGLFCDAFRRDLAENEHDDRHGDGGNGGTVVAECFDKQNGGERRRTDVDDVVSHQNGGDELVVIIHELIGELCALVAVIGQVFEPDTAERRKRRFRGGEIGGQNDQNDQRYDQPCTVTVHLRKNNLSFLQKICRSHMPLGMYDNIVYYHNTRKKANRKPVNFLKTQKAQELFKTSAPFIFPL